MLPLLTLAAMTWHLQGVAQAAKGGAGELAEVLWVGSAVCTVIREVLGAVPELGMQWFGHWS